MKSLPKFATALPHLLSRRIVRHIISLVPSLSATTPSSLLATTHSSDLALAADYMNLISASIVLLEMWANAQHDGRHAEYRWRSLFNAAKFG